MIFNSLFFIFFFQAAQSSEKRELDDQERMGIVTNNIFPNLTIEIFLDQEFKNVIML